MIFFDIYCELLFIDKFIEINKNIDIFDDDDKIGVYNNLIKIFKSNNTRISTKDGFRDLGYLFDKYEGSEGEGIKNPLIKNYINKFIDGELGMLEISPDTFAKNKYHRTFNFSNKVDLPPDFSNPPRMVEWKPYYKRSSKKVIPTNKKINLYSDDNLKHWSDISEFDHPSDSFVIIDNYICSRRDFNNLFSILKELLSNQNPSNNLDLTIVTSLFYFIDPTENKKEESISEIYKKIDEFICKGLGLNNVNFTLVKATTKENHDRHIFTNYFAFKAGTSFNFIDIENGEIQLKSITDFDTIPLTDFNKKETYAQYYKTHLTLIKDIVLKAKKGNFIGNRKNRILDFH